MKYIILLIVTLLLNNAHIFFINSSDYIFNFAYDAGQYCLFIFLFAFIFSIIPKENIKGRGISLVLMLMFINLLMNTIYDKLDIALFNIQYPLGIFLFLYLIHTTLKWDVKEKLVIIKPDKSYFVFKKPKNSLDFALTLFQLPTSSFSIISDNLWYKFSKNRPGLYTENLLIFTPNQKFNLIIEVNKIDKELLETLRKTSWSLYKTNCITVFKSVFESMNIKLNRFDFIPSIFACKFFRGSYGV